MTNNKNTPAIISYKELLVQNEDLAGNWEGYYWMSDAIKPEIIELSKRAPLPFEIFNEILPMVIEAQFFQAETQSSLSVKNIDGQLISTQVFLAQLDENQKVVRHYQTLHSEVPTCQIWEVWTTRPGDESVEAMLVRQPLCTAFGGFSN
ncbi:MAG: TIGR04423 family type III CRISPR-associated protein [Bacteroidota bacterium]